MSVSVIRREIQESFLPVEVYFFSWIPLLPISVDCAWMSRIWSKSDQFNYLVSFSLRNQFTHRAHLQMDFEQGNFLLRVSTICNRFIASVDSNYFLTVSTICNLFIRDVDNLQRFSPYFCTKRKWLLMIHLFLVHVR